MYVKTTVCVFTHFLYFFFFCTYMIVGHEPYYNVQFFVFFIPIREFLHMVLEEIDGRLLRKGIY